MHTASDLPEQCASVYVSSLSVFLPHRQYLNLKRTGSNLLAPSGKCYCTVVYEVLNWTKDRLLDVTVSKAFRFLLSSDHLTKLQFLRTPTCVTEGWWKERREGVGLGAV